MKLETAKKKYLNKRGLLSFGVGTLKFDVDIIEVRCKFGRVDLLVTPPNTRAGEGRAWTSSKFVELQR